jgi:hypothetical protein
MFDRSVRTSPRGISGWRRGLVAALVSGLLAANAIAYGVAPAASAATRPTRSQTAGLDSHPTLSNSAQALGTGSYPSLSTGSSASLFSQALLFVGENLLTGATRQAGSQLYDWGLAALGLANGAANSATQLADIRSELEAIQSQLADIDNALSLVSDEIQQLNCDQYGVGLENAVSTIQADYQIYETDYGQQGSAWSTTPATNVAVLDQFIAQVTQETYEGEPPELATPYSLVSALDTITEELVPTGGTQGALAACISAAGGAPKPGTFGTLSYYDNEVLPIEEYWYAYQLDALEMLTDAYDTRAWFDAGSPGIDAVDVASGVCVASQASDLDCSYAANVVDSTRQDIFDQWQVGGGPYDSDPILTVLNGAGLVVALSLTQFTQDADSSCTAPLTSSSPCGPAAGAYDMTTISGTYEGATGWTAATAAQLETLLDPTSANISGSAQTESYLSVWNTTDKNETPAAWLASQEGFQDTGSADDSNLVIGCPDTGAVKTGFENRNAQSEQPTFTATCFIDLGVSYAQLTDFDYGPSPSVTSPLFTPADSAYGQHALGNYSDLSVIGPNGCETSPPDWTSPTADNGYFNAVYAIGCDPPLSNGWVDTPQWVAGSSQDVYHWPVLDSASVSCTDGASSTNPAGVVSMCGADLTSYIETYVPALPSQVAFTSAAVMGAPSSGTTTSETVELEDSGGSPVASEGPVQVDLSAVEPTDTSESDTNAFFVAGGGPTGTVTIPAGSSTATFTLGDTLDGDAPTIEVTSFALSGASQTEYFADSAAGLEFTSGALTASTTSDRALGPVDVEFIDENGVETVPPPSQSVLAVEYRCTDSCDFASSSDGENQGAAILVSPSRTTSTSAYQVPTYHVYFSAPTAGTMTITAEAVNSDLSPYPTSAAWETHQDEAIASSPASLVLPDKTTRGR